MTHPRHVAMPHTTAAAAIDAMRSWLHLRPLLVTSDFDGTLAMPRMDPWAATIIPAAQRALRRLVATEGVHVALLSGRTASDLSRRVRVGGALYLGNQGLEQGRLRRRQRAESLPIVPHPSVSAGPGMAEVLVDGVPRLVPDAWLVVEAKLPAVTFHYRSAPDVTAAGRRVAAAVDRLDPAERLVRFPGPRSLELRPPGAPGKGETFRTLLDELRPAVAFMLGDDRTDVPAFQVLRSARGQGELEGAAIGVTHVTRAHAETEGHVDLVLASPSDVATFLGGLARALAPDPSTRHDPRSPRC
jgi:trehalose-phosphatase